MSKKMVAATSPSMLPPQTKCLDAPVNKKKPSPKQIAASKGAGCDYKCLLRVIFMAIKKQMMAEQTMMQSRGVDQCELPKG